MTTPLMVCMSLYIKCGGDGTDLRDARGLGSALGSFSLPRVLTANQGSCVTWHHREETAGMLTRFVNVIDRQ